MKNVHIQSIHFKNRILDFFDVFARKQSSSPVILHTILPLLRLVQSTAASEKDLSNKAAGVLRSRLGKARDVPSTADPKFCQEILESIHAFARHASTAEFSNLCSVCSLFVVRTLEASAPGNKIVIEVYTKTLDDYMLRKNSAVHPAFLLDLVRRFPARAFPLTTGLLAHAASGDVKKVYRQVQAFTILTVFSQQLSTLAKTVSKDELSAFVKTAAKAVYDILERASTESEAWNAQRLKDVVRFALHLARSSKTILGAEATGAWDLSRLEKVTAEMKAGEKTKVMKGLHDLLNQLHVVLAGKKDKKDKKERKERKEKKGKQSQESKVEEGVNGGDDDAMDVDEAPSSEAPATAKKEKAPSKKRKSLDGSGKKVKKVKATA